MTKEIKGKHPSKQNVKVAVDNCIFTVKDGTLHLLLIQMKKKPYTNLWALPGGLIRERESVDDAAARVLEEETGVRGVYLEQLYTFGNPSRDPFGRVVSVAYVALIPWARYSLRTIAKYADVRWWPVKDIPKKMAYDHADIAEYAKQRLAWKLEYTNVAWSLLPPKFTLTELQGVYEAVLGSLLDKRNFRKKILALRLVEEVGETAMRGAHRPAMLYRFKSTKPQIVDVL
ncbi:NUDIX hydrolase [Candidatus Uhrbacteria bacterium]|nr:NUDIX hydrolase [Candidatus Uhrbacteria bacterium]